MIEKTFQLQMLERYDFSWSSALLWPDDPISSVEWTVPEGITKSSESHTDTLATVWLERTAPGMLVVTGLATSVSGRKELIEWLIVD